MKQHKRQFYPYVLLLLLLLGCFFTAAYFVALLWDGSASFAAACRQALVSLLGLLLFTLLWFLFWTVRHMLVHHLGFTRAQKDANHSFLDEIDEALDRIAKGDFEARIDRDKFASGGHRMLELADKINHMAEELGGLETMSRDFVSNVSHEIQSPLTSIRGFVALLRDDGLSREDRLHYIDIIESESLRLSKLGEDLLRLSTLDSESVAFKPQKYALDQQLKGVIVLLEPQWSAKNIEVSLGGAHIELCADKDLLSQVWINLLSNSIKFTPVGGRIAVSVTVGDAEVSVAVSDTGAGMTEETLAHIFERFYMADKARSRKAGGSGLGLSIVKKIVQLHRGRIDVTSTPGEGSVFTVQLPQKSEPV